MTKLKFCVAPPTRVTSVFKCVITDPLSFINKLKVRDPGNTNRVSFSCMGANEVMLVDATQITSCSQ